MRIFKLAVEIEARRKDENDVNFVLHRVFVESILIRGADCAREFEHFSRLYPRPHDSLYVQG